MVQPPALFGRSSKRPLTKALNIVGPEMESGLTHDSMVKDVPKSKLPMSTALAKSSIPSKCSEKLA